MTTCIYYDLEEISLADIGRARIAAPGALEFILRGTQWPDEADGPRPMEVCSARETDYQQRLMQWVDELFESLGQSDARSALIRSDGVSLLEILRYRFLFEFAEIEQRLAAASAMAEKGAERICWVVANNDSALVGKQTSNMISPRIELVRVDRSTKSPNRAWQWFRSRGRRVVDRLKNAADAISRDPQKLLSQARDAVAIVEYYPNSAKTLVPVSKALHEKHGLETVWIAGRREVKQTLGRYGVESILLRELTPRSNRAGKHFGSAATRALRAAIDSLPDKIFCGTGSLFGKPMLVGKLADKLSEYAEEAAYWFDSLTEAFEAVRPRCVVSTTYGSTIGRAAAVAAHARCVPSVFVQHGMIPDHDVFTRFFNDLILVWGNAHKRTIVRGGIAESRIKVVGASPYDELLRRVHRASPSSFPQPGSPIHIGYMASRTGGLVVNYAAAKLHLTTIAEAVGQIAGGRLTVKTHPNDRTGMVEAIAKDFPHVRVIQQGNSQDVILQSDVVIVVSSTTGLEACIGGKPLIVIESKGVTSSGPYNDYGAALQVTIDGPGDCNRLAAVIRSLFTDSAVLADLADGRRRLIDDLLNGGKGDATELTAQAIVDLVRGTEAQSQITSAVR